MKSGNNIVERIQARFTHSRNPFEKFLISIPKYCSGVHLAYIRSDYTDCKMSYDFMWDLSDSTIDQIRWWFYR